MEFQKTNESTLLEFWDDDQHKAAENNYKTQSKEHNSVFPFLEEGVFNRNSQRLYKTVK